MAKATVVVQGLCRVSYAGSLPRAITSAAWRNGLDDPRSITCTEPALDLASGPCPVSCALVVPVLTLIQMNECPQVPPTTHASLLTTLQDPGIPSKQLKAHFQGLPRAFSPSSSLTSGQ